MHPDPERGQHALPLLLLDACTESAPQVQHVPPMLHSLPRGGALAAALHALACHSQACEPAPQPQPMPEHVLVVAEVQLVGHVNAGPSAPPVRKAVQQQRSPLIVENPAKSCVPVSLSLHPRAPDLHCPQSRAAPMHAFPPASQHVAAQRLLLQLPCPAPSSARVMLLPDDLMGHGSMGECCQRAPPVPQTCTVPRVRLPL